MQNTLDKYINSSSRLKNIFLLISLIVMLSSFFLGKALSAYALAKTSSSIAPKMQRYVESIHMMPDSGRDIPAKLYSDLVYSIRMDARRFYYVISSMFAFCGLFFFFLSMIYTKHHSILMQIKQEQEKDRTS